MRRRDVHGSLEVDRQARGDAPVVLADEGPGHDLIEDRGEDPAVGDAIPALESCLVRQLHPRPASLDVQVYDAGLYHRSAENIDTGDTDYQLSSGRTTSAL